MTQRTNEIIVIFKRGDNVTKQYYRQAINPHKNYFFKLVGIILNNYNG